MGTSSLRRLRLPTLRHKMTEKTMDDVLAELRKASMPAPAIGKGAARLFVLIALC